MQKLAMLIALGAWLSDEPPAAPKSGDAVRAAAEAHARAKMQADANRATAVKVVQQFDAAFEQAKTYLEPFRERLDLEIHYIEQTCGLNGSEAAQLQKRGAEIAVRAQTDLAKALAARAGQPRQAVVIVNGNALAVPTGISVDYLMDPAQVARRDLLRTSADALPPEARAKLAEADEQRHQRALAATRLAALVVLDQALLLSTSQRDAMGQLLDAAWTVPVAPGDNPLLTGPPHAANLLHAACLIVPDGKLDDLLRPAQHAALKALFEAAAQPAEQPQGMMMGGGMMGGGMGMQGGNMPVGGMMRPAPAVNPVRRGPVLELNVNPAGAEQVVGKVARRRDLIIARVAIGAQPVVGKGAQQVFKLFPSRNTELELMVDDVAAACELSDEQRAKLLLAGRLDMKRVATATEHGVGVNDAAGLVGQVRLDADVGQEAVFSDRSSAYQKVLNGKLSDEQRQRLSAARRERLAMRQRAVIAAVLQAIDQRVLLSHQQHQRLTEFLEVPLADDRRMDPTGGPRDEVLAQLAHVSVRELEALLDDIQRPLAMRVWQELWATASADAVPGAIEPERAGGLNRF